MKKDEDVGYSVEEIHENISALLEYFMFRYKQMNSLLAYVISMDYAGTYIIPSTEWDSNISQKNFSTKIEVREDGNIYVEGVENR